MVLEKGESAVVGLLLWGVLLKLHDLELDFRKAIERGEKRADWDHEIGDDLTLNLTLDFEPTFKTSATWSLAGVREAEVIGIGPAFGGVPMGGGCPSSQGNC